MIYKYVLLINHLFLVVEYTQSGCSYPVWLVLEHNPVPL